MQPGRGRPARRRSPRTRARTTRSPTRRPRRSAATSCIALLYSQGYLTQSQYENSLVYPMPKPDEVNLPSTQGVAAPYFANYVKEQLVHRFGPAPHVRRRPARDDDARRRTCSRSRATRSSRSCRRATPARRRRSSCSTRRRAPCVAMVGGENYHKNQFNLATQGERQPGSSFKPFVLATALQEQRRAVDRARLAPGHDQRRRPPLGGQQLRGRVPRADQPEPGDRVLRQLRLLAADGDRRPAQRARHREAARDHHAAARATSRSASAPSRRRRSRWHAPTRRFADGG